MLVPQGRSWLNDAMTSRGVVWFASACGAGLLCCNGGGNAGRGALHDAAVRDWAENSSRVGATNFDAATLDTSYDRATKDERSSTPVVNDASMGDGSSAHDSVGGESAMATNTQTVPSALSSNTSQAPPSTEMDASLTWEMSASNDGSSTLDRGPCQFEIRGALSPEVSTVGVVEWSVDLPALTEARVEFTLDDPASDEINVGSGGTIAPDGSPALLLGLKPGRSYTYRIAVTNGETECTSPDHRLVTELDPAAPTVTRTPGPSTAPRANGFTILTMYQSATVSIIDADGAVVWWTEGPAGCSRALMDWEGQYMWMMRANPATAGAPDSGDVRRVRMDGSEGEVIEGLAYSHHDFAVLPGGVTAFLVGDNLMHSDSASFLVERDADGTLHSLVRLDAGVFGRLADSYHANAVRYYADDDTYTVSDLYLAAIAKLNRQGDTLTLMGADCAGASAKCLTVATHGSHGHQLLPNGNLLYFGFDTDGTNNHAAFEYAVSRVGSGPTAPLVWSYAPALNSVIFGDVQRLPNGNTLVTFSQAGLIHEVSPDEELVQAFHATSYGYTHFRPSLYGPPQ